MECIHVKYNNKLLNKESLSYSINRRVYTPIIDNIS